ncbi:Predicted arabinose efflux permease, MFS family [Parapedobacter luteus]|uniref:Predicted arabinose efflux permease, MFS family n=1 Tax=Parapedobacter luteus TaxID=623280 RepID=A0A1T5BSH9_9SPHI|nr:MFS transporter [Parapedobacter luteus]SKB49800.1 Predicted arabinose efflux permease, MFS family [Parapedobacter luteus]
MSPTTIQNAQHPETPSKTLFWGCFMVLVASAFGFVFRSYLMHEWGIRFDLSKTQQGQIFGVSFWPFALSIVLFSLVIDQIGYKKSMIFAFICHAASVLLTIFANGYWMLYFGTFLFALGNGAAEAVINPVVASMYPREKTKWLNILHAGWPMGIAIAGLFGITLLHLEVDWRIMMLFILLPTMAYGALIFNAHFPVNERVKAGVRYIDMLREVGVLGFLIITSLCAFELGNLLGWGTAVSLLVIVVVVAFVGFYLKALGRPLLVVLLLVMVPLATMELGTDSWITDLMTPEMQKLGFQGGWVLVFTAIIMTVLRLYTGVVTKRMSPLGILAISALVSAVGLQWLSFSAGATILLAAGFYAVGKTYLWGTMLGVVSEQFPRGGALALNITSAVGQLGVGIIGAVFLGAVQDSEIDSTLQAYDLEHHTTYYSEYVTEVKRSIFGEYKSLNQEKLSQADTETLDIIAGVENEAKKSALSTVSILPMFMFLFYLGLVLYFRAQGGYKPVVLEDPPESFH